MPFQSERQRRYLWATHPDLARRWTDRYGSKPKKRKKQTTVKAQFGSRSEAARYAANIRWAGHVASASPSGYRPGRDLSNDRAALKRIDDAITAAYQKEMAQYDDSARVRRDLGRLTDDRIIDPYTLNGGPLSRIGQEMAKSGRWVQRRTLDGIDVKMDGTPGSFRTGRDEITGWWDTQKGEWASARRTFNGRNREGHVEQMQEQIGSPSKMVDDMIDAGIFGPDGPLLRQVRRGGDVPIDTMRTVLYDVLRQPRPMIPPGAGRRLQQAAFEAVWREQGWGPNPRGPAPPGTTTPIWRGAGRAELAHIARPDTYMYAGFGVYGSGTYVAERKLASRFGDGLIRFGLSNDAKMVKGGHTAWYDGEDYPADDFKVPLPDGTDALAGIRLPSGRIVGGGIGAAIRGIDGYTADGWGGVHRSPDGMKFGEVYEPGHFGNGPGFVGDVIVNPTALTVEAVGGRAEWSTRMVDVA